MSPITHRILSLLMRTMPLRVRFWFWSYLRRRGKEIWAHEDGAQRIEGGMYIKMTPRVLPMECHATHFVCTHTNIPVPVVVDNVTVDGATILVLSRLPGVANLPHRHGLLQRECRQRPTLEDPVRECHLLHCVGLAIATTSSCDFGTRECRTLKAHENYPSSYSTYPFVGLSADYR